MRCDPDILVRSAAAYIRIPKSERSSVSLSLLCAIAKKGTKPVGPVSGLSYTPSSEIIQWSDGHADDQTGNLATFNATADYGSVKTLNFSFGSNTITSISGLGKFPTLINLLASSELLTSLDISGCPNLSTIDVGGNNLTVSAVNSILTTLDANGLHNGTVIVSSMTPAAIPTGAGLTSAIALIDKGWLVTADLHALATSWFERANAHGGNPNIRSAFVLTGFSQAIDTASLTSHFKALNCFAPDDLPSACTPLIVGTGSDPWTQHNFLAGDLTVAGLKGNGASKYLNTGIDPSVVFAGAGINSAGITLYNTYPDGTGGAVDTAIFTGSTNGLMLQCNEGGYSRFECFTNNVSRLICDSQSGGLGYYSGNRTDSLNQFIYQAFPGKPHFQAGTNVGGPGASLPGNPIPIFCWNSIGGSGFAQFSFHRFSFAAIHDGFSQAQSAALYTAVDAMRTLFGGGNLQDNLSVIPAIHPTVNLWRYSVKAQGGADPSLNTLNALTTFMNSLDANSLTPKIKVINAFVPDSLAACLIPLMGQFGSQTWSNHNFVGGDLSVNGLKGDGVNKYLDTGILLGAFMQANSVHAAVYNSIASALGCEMAGRAGGTGKLRFGFDTGSLGNYFGCWTDATNLGAGNIAAAKVGYVCGVKSAANLRNIYFANSTNAHASIATNAVNESTAPDSSGNLYVMCGNEGSPAGFTNQRLSYFSLGLALTAADSASLYNAVQALRTALGGGFV